MLKLLVCLALVIIVLGAPKAHKQQDETECNRLGCELPNCKCQSTSPPSNIEIKNTPQFVFLTFDDALSVEVYNYYSEAFFNRTNPDGCPAAATFFISHEYTDYSTVHDLYVHHQEIALHSVTHSSMTDYWKSVTIDDLEHEFGDERTIFETFGNIPQNAIQGLRLPLLQLSGNNSFEATKNLGLLYDCSWPTQTYRDPGLWPYTLDYGSTQDCSIGPCPTEWIPGLWVVPMIDWIDQNNIVCAMVDACVNIPTDVDGLVEWFKDNFNVQYLGNRAPWGFYLHAAWFVANPLHFQAYLKFLDYLQTLPDVYLVGISTGLKWIQNPVPLDDPNWNTCTEVQDLGCSPKSCALQNINGETRYMEVCTSACPEVFPWLNNPLGLSEP